MGDMQVIVGVKLGVINIHLAGRVYLELYTPNMLSYFVGYNNYFKKGRGWYILIIQTVREILTKHGRLTVAPVEVLDDRDLYHAGLTSLATVGLMLALEDEFDIEFPDSMLSRKTFGSIESIVDAIEELQG
ncbi:Acyl carrier protein [hydrothermal vent metagenome]|uniref:Acyl carrier protein n=1 Tax=hydrothermal vent metagenome TaxID=652676 RepID=A0A3B0ZQL2_9ZZZZ